MENLITVIVLGLIIIYLTLLNYTDRRDFRQKENDLLNRLLAESFPEYVDGTTRLRRKPDKPLTSKERIEGIKVASEIAGDTIEVA